MRHPHDVLRYSSSVVRRCSAVRRAPARASQIEASIAPSPCRADQRVISSMNRTMPLPPTSPPQHALDPLRTRRDTLRRRSRAEIEPKSFLSLRLPARPVRMPTPAPRHGVLRRRVSPSARDCSCAPRQHRSCRNSTSRPMTGSSLPSPRPASGRGIFLQRVIGVFGRAESACGLCAAR